MEDELSLIIKKAERYEKSGNCFDAATSYEKAARIEEKARDWEKAAEHYLKAAQWYEKGGFIDGVPRFGDEDTGAGKCRELLARVKEKMTKDPYAKWKNQLEAACAFASGTVSIYAGAADEVYEQFSDIHKHYERVEEAFNKAFELAPDKQAIKNTKEEAIQALQKLAKQYRKEASRIVMQGHSLGEDFYDCFMALAKRFSVK